MHAGSKYLDPGATATDNVDGNITSRLSTYGVGAVKTTLPTPASAPYIIQYDVSDSAGNAATEGVREVVVACKPPAVACTASDGSLFCSTASGLCIQPVGTSTTGAGTKPTIELIGQNVLGITVGTSYLGCPDPQPTNVICDRWACMLFDAHVDKRLPDPIDPRLVCLKYPCQAQCTSGSMSGHLKKVLKFLLGRVLSCRMASPN